MDRPGIVHASAAAGHSAPSRATARLSSIPIAARDGASSTQPATVCWWRERPRLVVALYLTLTACSTTPQTVIVHQPVAPPLSAALTTCTPEPPKPPRTASDADYAIWDAAAIYAGRDCRNVLGKLVTVLRAFAASLDPKK